MSQKSTLTRPVTVLAFLALFALTGLGLRALARPALEDPPAAAPASLEETLKKIKNDADRTKPDVFKEIAAMKTREAMNALHEAYDAMQTIFMKREIIRVMPAFDGVADAEQPALQKLMDVATGSNEVELREAALDAIGLYRGHGKDFLRLIVTSQAEDSVREKAMKLHARMATKDDFAWYRELCIPKELSEKEQKELEKAEKEAKEKAKKEEKEREKNKGKGNDDKDSTPPKKQSLVNINPIRLICYQTIASTLTVEELMKSKKDKYPKIRRAALEELATRGDKKTTEFAEDILKNDAEDSENRVIAARTLAKIEGTKVAPDFIKRATAFATPIELRRGLAEILIGFNDEAINKDLIGDLGRGKQEGEKLFQIYAVRGMKDERVDKALIRMLADKDKAVVIAATKILGERKYKEALPSIKKLYEKGNKEREVMRAAVTATGMIRQGDPTWIDELVALTKSEDPEIRSIALDGLANTADKAHLDKLVAALEDKNWSTRLAALEGLERLHMKEAISPIILRMQKEEGRMKAEFANSLWRLTGQPYSDNAEGWTNWWKDNQDKFQLLSDADLERVKTGAEEMRLRQTTRVESKFFGIRIISHRVIFIIDVSGSMDEGLLNDYRGKPAKNRMEVAKNELSKCIQGLDSGALFNIYPFSSDVEKWIDGSLAAANEKNRASAVEFVEKLGPFGGTNLYGAIQAAFKDPDVDTIFIMSDGEPSVGDVIDPGMIREHVKAWNEHRKIVINTIAIGGEFSILEWIAEDSGGTNVKFE